MQATLHCPLPLPPPTPPGPPLPPPTPPGPPLPPPARRCHGIGLCNQAIPLFLSETTPYHLRGAFNITFQMATTLGIITAQLINLVTQGHLDGWRYSLGLAGIPALTFILGSACLPDSPGGLVVRGRREEARRVLEHLRGTTHVDAEYQDILGHAEATATVSRPILTISRRRYWPQVNPTP